MKSNEGSELINCSVDTEVKKPKNIIAKVMNQLRVKRSSNDKDTKKNIAVKENKDTEGRFRYL
jgi:fructose-specific phosphotransferase system component IIB